VGERLSDKQVGDLRQLIVKRLEDTETVLGRGKSSSQAKVKAVTAPSLKNLLSE